MLLGLLTLLAATGVVLAYFLLPGESSQAQRAPFWGVNFAHRGLHSQDRSVPENSLAAFTAAVDAGYAIELDVRLTYDGRVVVFHDAELQRMCGVPGTVRQHTLAQLSALTLLDTGQPIPTLRQALEVVGEKVPLLIELKPDSCWRELCEGTWRVLRGYDGDICVQSFDPRILRWFRHRAPGLLRGQLVGRPKDLGGGPAAYIVGWGLSHFLGRPGFIACQKGYRPPLVRLAWHLCMSLVWTVRPEDDNTQMELGYDSVIFEFYEPEPRFMQPPPALPDERDETASWYTPPY